MRRSSEARSAEVWARTFPRAFRLAHLLVGDASLAERIAEKTFVRMHVRYRDVTGDEGRDRWTLRTVVRLSRSRMRRQAFRRRVAPPSGPLGPLSHLRFRKRAAYVLSVYDDLDAGALAHALDCSPGGAIALSEAAEDIQVPGLRGASDARTDLARFGSPGWCPSLAGTTRFKSQTQGAVGDTAIRFDIALARRGYRQTIDALLQPAHGAPPVHEWPHHGSSSGLGVIQVTGGSTDPDLVRSCGGEAAVRSIKVAVLQRRGDVEAGELIAFYMVLVDDAWRVWIHGGSGFMEGLGVIGALIDGRRGCLAR